MTVPAYPKYLLKSEWDKNKGIIAKIRHGETGMGAALDTVKEAYDAVGFAKLQKATGNTKPNTAKGALDGITRADLQQWLSQVWTSVGATVLLVTHDITEAVLLSDRVYVMTPRPGQIATVIDIDLPRPRVLALREEDAFTTLEKRLRHELYQAMAS